MSAATLVLLAHHALVLALPFVVPVVALVIGAAVFTVRERRRREREQEVQEEQGEQREQPEQRPSLCV